jgi:hypothetical protein
VAFLLEVQSRRNDAFVIQCLRHATGDSGLLSDGRLQLCDRDPKWSGAVEQWLDTAGVHVVRTPPRAPNCNAFAERFVRSAKEECLDRIVPTRRTASAQNIAGVRGALPSRAESPRSCE